MPKVGCTNSQVLPWLELTLRSLSSTAPAPQVRCSNEVSSDGNNIFLSLLGIKTETIHTRVKDLNHCAKLHAKMHHIAGNDFVGLHLETSLSCYFLDFFVNPLGITGFLTPFLIGSLSWNVHLFSQSLQSFENVAPKTCIWD